MTIVVLGANQPADRFYRGGARIDAFRGSPVGPDRRPEDWIGSATALAGQDRLGLSVLPDGRLLSDAVESDPLSWLGAAHVAAFGSATMLLVKLLDAGQRLPVHAHPDDAFSRAVLHRPVGKAEAWYILEGGDVHLGLAQSVSRESLAQLVREQDTRALLDLLHTRSVAPGDVVFVPQGELHAIGEGVFLLELQQPEDLSILLEWSGFELDGEADGHLGIGFERALDAVRTLATTPAELDALVMPAGQGSSVLPVASHPFFRLARWTDPAGVSLEPGFAIVVVEEGAVVVTPETGPAVPLRRGETAAVAHASGRVRFDGEGTVLICRPPDPRG
ncbi:class I mannose-6-phosphate isomerase [Microbacterium sp. SSM24]|uniref:class I mannose-6-phosphate isomerase n=1 Tax=Microbacterium sp. SSM24 TaxID=2991714 RepID=UPI0022272883|nr:class I mannose-6-phosphate isomerase [Microbacterium sp. SSM24]MCW3493373.1 class I mannose-6-phosphate isomerase [Microbacterium sp. SSM24]